jgi:hypothetical protein
VIVYSFAVIKMVWLVTPTRSPSARTSRSSGKDTSKYSTDIASCSGSLRILRVGDFIEMTRYDLLDWDANGFITMASAFVAMPRSLPGRVRRLAYTGSMPSSWRT